MGVHSDVFALSDSELGCTDLLGKHFMGACEILEVKKINTSGYHPQTDGLVEIHPNQ